MQQSSSSSFQVTPVSPLTCTNSHARFHAHVCRTNSFNIFDFVVVFITTVSLIPGLDMRVIGTLRLLRAFRVVRIFARLESARKIITALSSSIVPVCNVLVVVLGKIVIESSLSPPRKIKPTLCLFARFLAHTGPANVKKA